MIKNLGTIREPNWHVRVNVRRANGLGSVQKKRSGISTKVEAQRVERELYAEAYAEAKNGINPTWENVVSAYLEDAEKNGTLSGNTLHNYRTHLLSYSVPHWQKRKIETIQRADVLKLLDEVVPKRSQATRRTNVKYISSVFRFAMQNGYCSKNPCEAIKFKVPQPDLNIWNNEQAASFLVAARNSGTEWYAIWAFALHSGMRSGELYGLQWRHIDLEKRIIRVAQAWSSKTGLKSTKNNQVRYVPINDALGRLCGEMKLQANPKSDDFVLPHLPKWTKGEQARELRMFILGLGLPEIRFHDLRATFASQLLLSGIAMHVVMAICGWKDLKTAQRYLRLSGKEVLGATNNLGYSLPSDEPAKVFHLPNAV